MPNCAVEERLSCHVIHAILKLIEFYSMHVMHALARNSMRFVLRVIPLRRGDQGGRISLFFYFT